MRLSRAARRALIEQAFANRGQETHSPQSLDRHYRGRCRWLTRLNVAPLLPLIARVVTLRWATCRGTIHQLLHRSKTALPLTADRLFAEEFDDVGGGCA